jgi:hypothetical protein
MFIITNRTLIIILTILKPYFLTLLQFKNLFLIIKIDKEEKLLNHKKGYNISNYHNKIIWIKILVYMLIVRKKKKRMNVRLKCTKGSWNSLMKIIP